MPNRLDDIGILCLYADGLPEQLAECFSDADVARVKKIYLFIDSRASMSKRRAARAIMREWLSEDKPFSVKVTSPQVMRYFIAFYEFIPDREKFQPAPDETNDSASLAKAVLQERGKGLSATGKPAPWRQVAKRLAITPATLRNVRQSQEYEAAITNMAVACYGYRDNPKERLRLTYTRFKARFAPLVGVRNEACLQQIWRAIQQAIQRNVR